MSFPAKKLASCGHSLKSVCDVASLLASIHFQKTLAQHVDSCEVGLALMFAMMADAQCPRTCRIRSVVANLLLHLPRLFIAKYSKDMGENTGLEVGFSFRSASST